MKWNNRLIYTLKKMLKYNVCAIAIWPCELVILFRWLRRFWFLNVSELGVFFWRRLDFNKNLLFWVAFMIPEALFSIFARHWWLVSIPCSPVAPRPSFVLFIKGMQGFFKNVMRWSSFIWKELSIQLRVVFDLYVSPLYIFKWPENLNREVLL